nr:hypothetical protein [Candidatus Gracilibacteria bacterium]
MKKQKKVLKKIFCILMLIIILFGFYKVNELNYQKKKQIQENLVNHPENLPKNDVAKATSFGFKNIRADIYRLETIQYIGGNAINSSYKKYLYQILDLITDLNPFFEHPYIIGQLLLPDYNERYEKLAASEQEKYKDQAIEIGLKGIKIFCNEKIIEKINKEDNLQKIWNDKEYENPCKSYQIPFYLAYIYYFYKNDPINSSLYYKVASANKDSLEGAKILAAIMQGKGGNREKSIFMFLTLAQNVADTKKVEDKACLQVANEMKNIKYVDSSLIKGLEVTIEKIFGKFDEKKEKQFLDTDSCQNYLNKAAREVNLFYLDEANKKYFKDTGKNAKDAKELFDKGYIDYIPKDFQQYKDYGIIYIFNEKTGYFDYDMGKYGK